MYAKDTDVSPEKSKQEIERTLTKYGATSFAYGWEQDKASIIFVMEGRHIRFVLPMPTIADFAQRSDGGKRPDSQRKAALEQAIRQRWRALALAVKAKLECVESGITSFEDEFLAHIVLPNGNTVGHLLRPRLAEAYATGKMPPLLLGAGN